MISIVYIFTSAGVKPNSVQNKVIEQIKAIKINGLECFGLFFTTDDFEEAKGEFYDLIKVKKITNGFFVSYRQRLAYHKAVLNYLECYNLKENNILYFRYPGASRVILRLSRKYKNKIFFDHLSAEIPEIKLYKIGKPFRFNPSTLLSYLEFLVLPIFNEKIYGGRLRRNSKFGICNSPDVAKYQNKIAKKDYIKVIVGDAVNTENYRVKKHTNLENTLRMVFLKGASGIADYNGLDRILKSISLYNGEYNLSLYLYGKITNYEMQLINQLNIRNKVVIKGYSNKEEIDIEMDNYHIGISSFGIHRKGLKSITTIKSREYFARGLPFIYGHHDPDLSDNPIAKKYSLQLPCDETFLDFEMIIEWYKNVLEEVNYPSSMHEFSKVNLDYKVKTKKLIDFLSLKTNKNLF